MKNGNLSPTRFSYRTGTTVTGIVIASRFGGWYGVGVSALAMGTELTYDFGAWWGENFAVGMTQIESGMKNGWVPGRY